jgi:hypothetical protein
MAERAAEVAFAGLVLCGTGQVAAAAGAISHLAKAPILMQVSVPGTYQKPAP